MDILIDLDALEEDDLVCREWLDRIASCSHTRRVPITQGRSHIIRFACEDCRVSHTAIYRDEKDPHEVDPPRFVNVKVGVKKDKTFPEWPPKPADAPVGRCPCSPTGDHLWVIKRGELDGEQIDTKICARCNLFALTKEAGE